MRAVIFDCFGVLVRGSLDYLVSLAPEQNAAAVRDLNHAADYGYVSHQEYLVGMGELLGMSPERVEEVNRQTHVRDEPMIQYVKRTRMAHKTALLSNVGYDTIEPLFSEGEQAQLFDTVVLSSTIHAAKPGVAIFEYTANRLGVAPEECIMIDDIRANVDGAERAGMQGVLFTTPKQTVEMVERLLKEV